MNEKIILDKAINCLDSRYCISGFRSLREFKITLTPGLNVIVGPNGSGKTNFIDFLDFIDFFMRSGAASAVSSLGGASRVFSVEQVKNRSSSIFASIEAIGDLPNYVRSNEVYKFFSFNYEFELKFSKKDAVLYLSKEIITFRRSTDNINDANLMRRVGAITVTRASPSSTVQPKITISKKLFWQDDRNPLYHTRLSRDRKSVV